MKARLERFGVTTRSTDRCCLLGLSGGYTERDEDESQVEKPKLTCVGDEGGMQDVSEIDVTDLPSS